MSKPTLFSTNSLGNWLTFQTSTGSFSSNYTLSFPLATDTAVYEAFTQGMSNKTFTSTTITDASNTVTAQRLGTSSGTGFDVVVNGSTPSGANKVLVTTSATAAAWGTIPNSALTNSSVTINTGTGLTGGGTVALGGTLNLSNTGVISFSAGTTGLTPSIATTGAITLAGTLVVGNGGTGQTTFGTGSILLGNGSSALSSLADVATGSVLTSGGIGLNPTWTAFTSAATASTIASRDVNANTAFNNLTEGLTSTATTAGTTTLTTASTYYQLFTGATTQTVTLPTATVGQGYFVINNSTGNVTVNASGGGTITTLTTGQSVAVTGLTAAGTTPSAWYAEISGVSGGVTSFQTSLSGLSPSIATTGSVTLSGTLGVSSGGTGITTVPTNGQIPIGNGTTYTAATLTAGTAIGITNGAGSITINNNGVTSFSAGTTGLTPSVATTGAITLAGTLVAANGGTGQNTYTVGDILYASAATTLSKLSDVAAGSYLRSGGVGVAPLWSTLTLPNSATTGDLFYASGTNTMGNLADVATGNALISGGVGVAPSWGKVNLTTTVSGVLPIANGGTNSSTALNNNRIMVSSGGAIVEAAALTNGQLLIGSTGAAPVAATLTAGTGISITNGAGSISVAVSSSLASVRLTAVTNQITVGVGAPTVVGYVPWQNSAYSSFTTRTVVMWVVPSSAAGKDLTVSITPDGAAALGSITILGGAAVGAIYTFTFTAPGADTNLQVTVSRTGGGGNNPLINGVTVSLT